MSPDEARRDAQRRFGDFEANRRECRRITLGPRLLLQRIQSALLVVLIAVVAYLGIQLFRLQANSAVQIEALTRLVEQFQAARQPVHDEAAIIPYVHWTLEAHRDPDRLADQAHAPELVRWSISDRSLLQPWSNWQALEGAAEEF
jgi:hypothetical protein